MVRLLVNDLAGQLADSQLCGGLKKVSTATLMWTENYASLLWLRDGDR